MTDTAPLSRRRLRTWLRLLRITRGTENHLREFLRVEFDTTLPRFDVAAALFRANAPIRMSDLSQLLLVSNGNATTVVDRLEHEGRARRIAQEGDRRVVLVELTPAGRDWFREIAAAHEREVDRIFAGLGPDDLSLLRDIIRRAERTTHDQDA